MFEDLPAIVAQSKKITDPGQLKDLIECFADLVDLQRKNNKTLRDAIDQQELSKQQSLKITYHRVKRTAFGFGREINKIRDRERYKTEKQLTMQSRGIAKSVLFPKEVSLPKKITEHKLTEGNLLAVCHTAGMKINEEDSLECEQMPNFYEDSCEITVTEKVYTKVLHRRIKYKVVNKTTGEEKIVTAPGPVKLYPKCRFSVDFAVGVVSDKFLNYLPYERQRKELRRAGLNVPVSTYCRLEKGISIHLEDVYENIRKNILETKHLAVGLDETRWPILCKSTSNGYFWIICNQAGSYYRFEPTRSGAIAAELLKDYKGSIISDKFSGYLQFSKSLDIVWGLCLAHGRRDFISLQESYPKECGDILTIMDDVFKVEHEATSWESLKQLRQTKSKKLMTELKLLLQTTAKDFLPKEAMTLAINYLLSNWKEFTAFLSDVSIPVSNNESERALRQVVLGRKNYRGSKTIDAADQAAILFSIIESCKKAELDPKDYIKYVVENNHYGEKSLTPLEKALESRGKAHDSPEEQVLLPS